MKKMICFVFCLAIVSTGCSIYRIDSEDLPNNTYPAKPSAAAVEYIPNIGKLPHEIIGYAIVQAERSQPFEEISLRLRHEAARLGGDAITNIETDSTGFWKKLPAQKIIGNAYVRAKFRATVIKLP